ncbi:hypothetical protein [Delftia tsuruhatensis]|uniref:hypothetical protein n=1 Tax=Delftia tsuruhatensis TaxID=180282 RepID=UPI000774E1C8|nr:hypothetical protein [Delftia tsuruhatensis]SFB61413.1 hypothetical protein SAMN05444579_11362 [Delftia tsuruhatensis]
MTDIVNIPDLLPISQYPALGSANFNQEAYNYATSVPPAVSRMREVAVACRTCAIVAREQADAAMGYRNQAANSAAAAEAAKAIAQAAASSAETAKNQAQSAAASAASSAQAVDQYMLGPKAVPPSTDNQGGAIKLGAMYINVGTDPNLNNRWFWWGGNVLRWVPGVGDLPATFMPRGGGIFTGHIEVPQGASGNQAPRANEVVPRSVAYYDKSIPMSAAPVGTVCFFESTDGGGIDWPYKTNVTIHGWLVETWDRGGVRSMQEATFTLSGFAATGAKFRRYKHDTGWSAWARELSDLDFRERVVSAYTGVGPGAAKLYYLDPKVGSIHHVIVEYNTHFAAAFRDIGDQVTLRMQFYGGAWPVSFNSDLRFPVGASMPTYTAGQIVTVTFIWTRAGYIDAFVAGVHTA